MGTEPVTSTQSEVTTEVVIEANTDSVTKGTSIIGGNIEAAPAKEEKVPDANLLGAGEASSEWKSGIDKEFLDHPVIKNAKDLNSLAKSLVHAQSLVGSDKFVIPGEGANDEQWNEVYGKLGRPEAADKYDFTVEGADEAMMTGFKDIAHTAGLNNKQAKNIVEWYSKANGEVMTSITEKSDAKINEQIQVLKTELGPAFAGTVENAKVAARFYEDKFPELKDIFDVPEVGSHPAMIKMLAAIGGQLVENKMVTGTSMNQMGGKTPEDAQKEMGKIRSDKDHPYNNPKAMRSDRDTAIKEFSVLQAIVTGAKHPAQTTSI